MIRWIMRHSRKSFKRLSVKEMISSLKKISIITAIVLLAGCAKPVPIAEPQLVATPDRVSMLLAEAADRSSRSLETLAAIEQYQTPKAKLSPISNAPIELQRAVTMSWVGPVDQVAKRLSEHAGYSFMALGDRPPVPIVVSLDVENRPVIDVLRDIGLQMGTRADIRVDASRKLVELQYSSVSLSGY